MKQRYNEDFDEQFKKRLENNNLTLDDVKKKRKLNDNDQYMYLNMDKEDPDAVGHEKLMTLSNRKMWKIKHKKSLNRKNKRLEKKGVFIA